MTATAVHVHHRAPDGDRGGDATRRGRTGGGPTRGDRPPAHLAVHPAVQRLKVSEPSDPLEVQAAAAARRIVAGQPVRDVSAVGGGAARLAVGEDDETVHAVARLPRGGPVTTSAGAALRHPVGGRPVPPAVRSAIEPRLGADLGGVLVHDDAGAHRTSAALGARALTYGNHIFLGGGESPHDLALMAHEATHVVQQGAAFGPAAVGHAPPAAAVQAPATVHAARGDQVQLLPALITDRLAPYARHIPGYTLLTVVIGYDPLAGVRVERSATSLVGGLMGLVPFGTAVFDRLVELGVIGDALAFVEQQLATFDLSLARLERVISEAWDRMDFVRLDPFDYNVGVLTEVVGRLVADVTGFARALVGALVDLIRDAVVDVVEPLLAENPAWSLITKVLRHDPLRDTPVEATTVEILADFLLLIGRETELAQMRERGVLQETADWLDTRLGMFLGLLAQFRALFTAAWDAIQPANLPDLMSNLRALAHQAVSLLQQAWDFAADVAAKVLELVKKALLGWLSDFAHEVPGFHLLTVILGRNPFTGDPVARTATNLIRGFITLLPGGAATYEQLAESGVVGQAAATIEAAMADLGISWAMVTDLFLGVWDSVGIDDLVDPIGAFTRIRDRFGEPIGRLFAFVRVVVREIFTLVLALMSFPTDVVARIVSNAMAAWADVSRDPVGFLLNLLSTVKEGFTRFFGGIFDHLLGGLLDWLFRGLRDAGIEPPTELSIQAGLDLLMQVLGITEERLWTKLAERIGQERVDQIRGAIDRLTGIWTFVKDVQERGVAAVWEYVRGQLSNLWDVIISTARTWIMEKIVTRVTTWLLSLLDPTFIMSVVNGFVAVFNAISAAVEYVREMLDIVDLVVGTVASIARGDVAPGAAMLEQGLVAAIPIAIGFLAYQVGLGRIGDKIAEIVAGVRELVDRALDWLMDQAERALQAVLGMLGMGAAQAPADQAPSDVDPRDHPAVARRAARELAETPVGVDGYSAARAAVAARAAQVAARYTPLLEPGIALTVRMAGGADEVDQDVDFTVLIAPNTTEVPGAVPVPLFERDDPASVTLSAGGEWRDAVFVETTEVSGNALYKFRMTRYQEGTFVLIPPSATDRYSKRELVRRGPHTMQLSIEENGAVVVTTTLVSGNMTQEEYELGYPRNTLATHTEARALQQYSEHIREGSRWRMVGHYLSCSHCKGRMNEAGRRGAHITYEPGGFTAARR